MLAHVYKSLKKADTYFYLAVRDEFARLFFGKNLSKHEIAHRRRVKDGVRFFTGERLELRAQIRRGGEGFDRPRPAFARPGGGFADEQRDVVALGRQKIGEFRAQPARGEIREPAHVVQRFKRRPGGDDAVHAEV